MSKLIIVIIPIIISNFKKHNIVYHNKKMLTCIFEKYKDSLGKPGEGIHKYRFLNTAIMDYVMSIIMAIILAYLTKVPLVLTTIGVFAAGLLSHVLFCVNTNTVRFLEGETAPPL